MNRLSAVGIKKAGPGKYYDGGGLELHKTEAGGKWIWRYSISGRRREMGLGSYPSTSLADARKERDRWDQVLSRGNDPIAERQAARAAAIAEMERDDPTLQDLASVVLEAKKDTLRSGGTSGRWLSPLKIHVFPKLGRKPISTIHRNDIHGVLKPIWRTKHPTAQKAIQRLSIIFRQGKLMGYDCDPFTIEAAKHMLGEVVHEAEPIPATPWQDIPTLYKRLDGRGPVAACLQFMILTVVRSAGCRGVRFSEIEDDVWTVPADRMKGNVGKVKDFRVPLSAEAMKIVERQSEFGGEFLFSFKGKKPITDVALSKHLNLIKEPGRAHGFRTSFRTWVQDTEATDWDVSETVLAHTIGGKVERSYARSDLLDRRRIVMNKWAEFVTGVSAEVVKLRG